MSVVAEPGRLDIGRAARETVGVLQRAFPLLFVLSLALSGLPTAVLQYFQVEAMQRDGAATWMTLYSILGGFLSSALATGAVVHGAVRVLEGARPGLGECLWAGLRHFVPLLIASLLVGLCAALGMVALVVPGLLIFCAWFVYAPVMMVERAGVFRSLDRSQQLTRNNRLLLLGLVTAYGVAILAASVLVEVVAGGPGVFDPDAPPAPNSVLSLAGTALYTSLAHLVGAVGATVVYAELRRLKEGRPVSGLAEIFS
jgi:hypothetical protein